MNNVLLLLSIHDIIHYSMHVQTLNTAIDKLSVGCPTIISELKEQISETKFVWMWVFKLFKNDKHCV